MSKRQAIVAVVDDDTSMLRAMETLLEAHGFKTLLFTSAEEFLTQSASSKVTCLLLDVDLGGMSGIELHKQLKNSGAALPTIFMTALDDEGTRTEAAAEGAVAFLRKPFPARQLIDAIKKSAS